MTEAEERAAVVAEARSWLKTPYHHQADVKGAGVDCAYLLIRVYHAVGLLPDINPGPYPPDWHLHQTDERYLGWVQRYAEAVDQPQPGDIVLYRFGKCASHGAIVLDWPLIIHAYLREGCVVSDALADERLRKRQAGFYSIWAKKRT